MEETNNKRTYNNNRILSTDEFIRASRDLYGDLYCYDKAEYIDSKHKVKIICPVHGEFEIFAREHLDGRGCDKCEKGEKFLAKLHEKYGDKFGLDNFIYVNSSTPVELICPTHGPFRRLPDSILSGSCGCILCGKEQLQVTGRKPNPNHCYDSEVSYKKRLLKRIEEEQRQDEEYKEAQKQKFELLNKAITEFQSLPLLKKKKLYFLNGLQPLPDSFVGIDFETLYAQRVSACSVGLVKYKNGEITDRYYTLIRPPFDYPGKCGPAITWVHGFTEESLVNERTFNEILPEMEEFIEGLPLVAHNACVEKACIQENLCFYNLETNIDYLNIYDTLSLSRKIERMLGIYEEGPGMHCLDEVCRRFGITEMKHHKAIDDAEMCGNLMLLFTKILDTGSICESPNNLFEYNENISIPRSSKILTEDKIQREDLDNVCDNPFKNKVVVLTGFTIADSQKYGHALNELGAILKDNVNKKTNILITGYNAGPAKMQKAKEFGAQIMSECEMIKILES